MRCKDFANSLLIAVEFRVSQSGYTHIEVNCNCSKKLNIITCGMVPVSTYNDSNGSLSNVKTRRVLSKEPDANLHPSQFQPTLCTLEL